jgi:hypothetical protein
MHKLIYVLQSIKKNLKAWNKVRLKTNPEKLLEDEDNRVFLQLDNDP